MSGEVSQNLRLYRIEQLTRIADAIRANLGTTDTYTIDEMGEIVEELQGVDLMELMAYTDSDHRLSVSDAVIKSKSLKIPDYMFSNTYTELVDMVNVEIVGANAFYGCHLSRINLPSCKTIRANAFYHFNQYWAGGVEDWNLDSCETFGDKCFFESKIGGLLDLPECKTIGVQAFDECTFITGLNLPKCESIGTKGFSSNAFTFDIELPAIETLANNAFNHIRSTNFTIGPNCTSIGSGLFGSSTTGVTNLYVLATTPPTLGGAFKSGNTGVSHIYVPSGSVTDYQSANNWSNYSSIIEAIPSA